MLDRLIYGGSFDPPHRGHAVMARFVLEHDIARRLDIVPARTSPFKMNAPPVAPEVRVAMLRGALADPNLERAPLADEELACRVRILELELKRRPPSYTVDTCRALRRENPGERIGLLMGSDSVAGLKRWKDAAEVLEHHEIVVFTRAGAEPGIEMQMTDLRARFSHAKFQVLDNPRIDCSSTELRLLIAEGGADVENCLAPGVLELVNRHNLYGRTG